MSYQAYGGVYSSGARAYLSQKVLSQQASLEFDFDQDIATTDTVSFTSSEGATVSVGWQGGQDITCAIQYLNTPSQFATNFVAALRSVGFTAALETSNAGYIRQPANGTGGNTTIVNSNATGLDIPSFTGGTSSAKALSDWAIVSIDFASNNTVTIPLWNGVSTTNYVFQFLDHGVSPTGSNIAVYGYTQDYASTASNFVSQCQGSSLFEQFFLIYNDNGGTGTIIQVIPGSIGNTAVGGSLSGSIFAPAFTQGAG